jgi:hypothetical protein
MPALPADVAIFGVTDGARTHNRWNHNPELYQLSYGHREAGLRTRPNPAGQILARRLSSPRLHLALMLVL